VRLRGDGRLIGKTEVRDGAVVTSAIRTPLEQSVRQADLEITDDRAEQA
jgi:hypothetical protein